MNKTIMMIALFAILISGGCAQVRIRYDVYALNNSKSDIINFDVSIPGSDWHFDFGQLNSGEGGSYQGEDLPAAPTSVAVHATLANGTIIQRKLAVTRVPDANGGKELVGVLVVELGKSQQICAEFQEGERLGRPTATCWK